MSATLVLFSSSVFLPLVVLLMAAISAAAQGATAGELLEKAIYAEETVGNLDEAVKLYEQVIAEGKTARSAAAKAQYRLGLIYEKQGKTEAATAAFRESSKTTRTKRSWSHRPGKSCPANFNCFRAVGRR